MKGLVFFFGFSQHEHVNTLKYILMTAVWCSGLHRMDFVGSPDSEEEEGVQLSHDELRQRIINTVRRGGGDDLKTNG